MKITTFVLLLLVFSLISCATRSQLVDESVAFKEYWNPVLDKAMDTSPENLSRIRAEESSLVIEGSLVDGDCDRVKAKLESFEAVRVIVNSQGGLVSQGLCITRALTEKGLNKVSVRGVCFSSCANYIFLGAKDRVIERGVVGFHGNYTALLRSEGILAAIEKAEASKNLSGKDRMNLRSFISRPKSSAPLNDDEKRILKKVVDAHKQEQMFFKQLQISQQFFDMTQKPDKGEGTGTPYMFLMPSADFMARELNIRVQGNQDVDFIKKANLKFPVGFLYKD